MANFQQTEEWFTARLGKATASRVSDVCAKIKSGEASTRRNYRIQLVCERITGTLTEHFTTRDMEWGTEQEPFARAAYEAATGNFVDECGSVDHSTIPMFAASPDGLIGKDGLIEIKCPRPATHLEWMLDGRVPAQHKPQMIAQIACTGRKWVDFVSFDPRMPEHLQLFIVRFTPSPKEIEEIEAQVSTFLAEVEESHALLMGFKLSAKS
jgi:putative phage-type endonuclease